MRLYLTNTLINLLITIFVISCSKPTEPIKPPPPPPPVVEEPILTLELDDAHCTEAWLILKTEKLTLPAELTIKQFNSIGDSVSQLIKLTSKDTLVYIDSLYPNQTYKYQVTGKWYPKQDSQRQVTSNNINVKTMDTTSHNFTFEMVTFGGEIGSSVLYDVAIINENDIWAVGEIWIADTSQLGYTKYNAVHWDGNNWELKQLLYNNSVFSPIRGILMLDENNFYFSAGSIFRWDGSSNNVQMVYSRLSLPEPNGTIEKLWGESANNIYGVGNVGSFVYYNGTSWSRIESNTTLNINDIWGDYNPKTGEWEILAVACNRFSDDGISVIKIDGLNTKELNKNELPRSLNSVWFKANKKYFVGGDGIFSNKKLNDNWIKDTTFIPIYKDRIRGININDIVVSGSNGLLSHYNGYSWLHYINNELPYYSGRLLSVDIKQNVTVAVGWIGSQAIITIGKR